MIIALCSVVALLAAPSLAQGPEDALFSSPCPSVFTYDPPEAELGSWSGVATLSSDILLHSLWLNIVLDSPALRLEQLEYLGDATTQDNVNFKIENGNLQIHPGQPMIVRFSIKYDYRYRTPKLQEIRLNGQVICNAQAWQPLQSNNNPIPIYPEPNKNSSATFNSGDQFSNIPTTTTECGVIASGNNVPLIYNGMFYERGEIPWLVAIYRVVENTLQFICGGTLVSDRHVVTAAHCMQRPSVTTPKTEIVVKLGVHHLNDWTDELTVIRKLMAATIYEEYDPYRQQNDILILTLDKSVQFNNYIRPACLWKGDTELTRVVGATGVVAGWGARSAEDLRGKLDEPQKVRVPIVSTTECRGSKAAFHEVTHSTTLCAGNRDGAGPCTGDSGSGLYLLQGGKWTLRGVVSLSLQNTEKLACDLNEYVVFTDAAQFLPWIKNVLSGNYVNRLGLKVVETLGPWGPSAHRVVRDISKQLVDSSRDQRAGLFFSQRISIAIQRGNAASVLGTFPIDIDVDEFFDALSVRHYSPPTTKTIECGYTAQITPLIYKGWSFEREQLPWLVAIFTVKDQSLRFICAGTLVSDRHVVTAAVCMRRRKDLVSIKDVVVKLGVHNLNDWSDEITVTRTLKAATVHEEYNSSTLQNDILMLTLDKTVRFNDYIRPACLWTGNTDLSLVAGRNGFVAGWGDHGVGINARGEPRMVNIPIVSTDDCRASNHLFSFLTYYNTTLCAGDRNGSGPCIGDSGDGLYLYEDGKWRIRGMVSVSLRTEDGTTTCNLNEYIVFTDTAQYLPWIKNIMAQS